MRDGERNLSNRKKYLNFINKLIGVIIMKTIIVVLVIAFFISSCGDKPTNPTIINFDTVKIGTQVWMLKNLDVDHYRNGDPILEVKDSATWIKITTGAWCNFNNSDSLGKIFGKLYNWYAVKDPRGLAPTGWHIPSDSDWTKLTTYLGGETIAGGKLKSTGTFEDNNGLWKRPNTGATNESGFTGLPGGYLTYGEGGFHSVGVLGYWWSSTKGNTAARTWVRNLSNDYPYMSSSSIENVDGFSVRCIKDK